MNSIRHFHTHHFTQYIALYSNERPAPYCGCQPKGGFGTGKAGWLPKQSYVHGVVQEIIRSAMWFPVIRHLNSIQGGLGGPLAYSSAGSSPTP